jgi:phospholipase D1/2
MAGVKIKIIMWKDLMVGYKSYEVQKHMASLHKNIKVLRHPPIYLNKNIIWSHHEKLLIIDQEKAFLGGIDLCLGRWDTK